MMENILRINAKIVLLVVAIIIFQSPNSFSQGSFENEKHELRWDLSLAANTLFYPLATLGTGATLITVDGIAPAGGDVESKSYSISLIPKYFFKKNVGLRFEFGVLKFKNDADISAPTSTGTPINYKLDGLNSIEQKTLKYSLGVERKDIITNRFELHSGLGISFFSCSDVRAKYYLERRDKSTDTLQYSESTVRLTDGGMAIGLCPFIGFDYYPCKAVSVGLEFSASYLYYDVGGNNVETQVSQVGQQSSTTIETTSQISYRGFRLEKPVASISISIHI